MSKKTESKPGLKVGQKVVAKSSTGQFCVGTVTAVTDDVIVVWPDQLPHAPVGVAPPNVVPVPDLP